MTDLYNGISYTGKTSPVFESGPLSVIYLEHNEVSSEQRVGSHTVYLEEVSTSA